MAKDDTVVTISRSGRRRFIRIGSAFLMAGAGATVAQAQEEGSTRSDCDGVGNAGTKNTEAAKTDSDSGASADRQGCGRNIPITYRKETKPIA